MTKAEREAAKQVAEFNASFAFETEPTREELKAIRKRNRERRKRTIVFGVACYRKRTIPGAFVWEELKPILLSIMSELDSVHWTTTLSRVIRYQLRGVQTSDDTANLMGEALRDAAEQLSMEVLETASRLVTAPFRLGYDSPTAQRMFVRIERYIKPLADRSEYPFRISYAKGVARWLRLLATTSAKNYAQQRANEARFTGRLSVESTHPNGHVPDVTDTQQESLREDASAESMLLSKTDSNPELRAYIRSILNGGNTEQLIRRAGWSPERVFRMQEDAERLFSDLCPTGVNAAVGRVAASVKLEKRKAAKAASVKAARERDRRTLEALRASRQAGTAIAEAFAKAEASAK
jgi:hypothetical protein